MSQLIIGVGGSQKQNANLPTNAVISDMVKAIVVTESAPDQQDNILYFEYEPISMMLARSVENETVDEKTQQITVQGAGGSGVTATIVLNQTAGDPTLEVSPTSIDVPQDGSEVSVQVTTNTTFTVS